MWIVEARARRVGIVLMRIGNLFSGYGGGLDTTVVSNARRRCRVARRVRQRRRPARSAAHQFPGVPNYGDVTAVDWAA